MPPSRLRRFTTSDGVHHNQLVFITFCPEAAKTKQRLVYLSSQDIIKSKLIGILSVHAHEASDFTLEKLISKAQARTVYG